MPRAPRCGAPRRWSGVVGHGAPSCHLQLGDELVTELDDVDDTQLWRQLPRPSDHGAMKSGEQVDNLPQEDVLPVVPSYQRVDAVGFLLRAILTPAIFLP